MKTEIEKERKNNKFLNVFQSLKLVSKYLRQ